MVAKTPKVEKLLKVMVMVLIEAYLHQVRIGKKFLRDVRRSS